MHSGGIANVLHRSLVKRFGRDGTDRFLAGVSFLFACALLTVLFMVDIPIPPGSVTRTSIVVDSTLFIVGKSPEVTVYAGTRKLEIRGATFRGAYTADTLAGRIIRAQQIDIWTSPAAENIILGVTAPEIDIPASSGLEAEASNRMALIWLTGSFFALSLALFWNPSFRHWREQRRAIQERAHQS